MTCPYVIECVISFIILLLCIDGALVFMKG